MPSKYSPTSGPYSMQAWSSTSVSEWVENEWPREASRLRRASVLYSSPL